MTINPSLTLESSEMRTLPTLEEWRASMPQNQNGTLPSVYIVYDRWVVGLDHEVLDTVFACACDREIPGDPIWLDLIAPPGGLKTELLHALRGWHVIYIDKLTRNTLISGFETKTGVKIRGLMPKLDGQVALIRDFTLLLEMDRRERNEIFAQLRTAYDGELCYGYGVLPEPVTVRGTFGLIAAVTPVIDLYTTAQSLLGERFVKIRAEQSRVDSAEQSRKNQGLENQMRMELNSATIGYLTTLKFDRIPELTDTQNKTVEALAEFVAQARTVVKYWIPDGGGAPQCDLEPCPEYATRVVKQLSKLLKLLAIIRRHETAMEDDVGTIRRIACDTILPRRVNVLRALFSGGANGETEIMELTQMVRQPVRTALEELELIRLVRPGKAGLYDLTAQFRQTMKDGFAEWPKMTIGQAKLPTITGVDNPIMVAPVGNPITPIRNRPITHARNHKQALPDVVPSSNSELEQSAADIALLDRPRIEAAIIEIVGSLPGGADVDQIDFRLRGREIELTDGQLNRTLIVLGQAGEIIPNPNDRSRWKLTGGESKHE